MMEPVYLFIVIILNNYFFYFFSPLSLYEYLCDYTYAKKLK